MTGSHACQNPCWNPLPTSNNEFAGATPTKDSGTFISISTVLRTSTPFFAIAIAGTRACSSFQASIDNNGSCALSLIPACAHYLFRSSF